MWTLDPAIHLILRLALALLFAWAAIHKLRDVARFRAVLLSYAVLPSDWTGPCAVVVIAMEVGIASGLCVPGLGTIAGVVAGGLLTLYAVAIAINLARGRHDIDCGCAGGSADRPLSRALVLRNGILAGAAGMAALPAAARSLGWLDGVTIMAGVTMLVLLYAAIDTLLASAPKLALLNSGAVAAVPAQEQHA